MAHDCVDSLLHFLFLAYGFVIRIQAPLPKREELDRHNTTEDSSKMVKEICESTGWNYALVWTCLPGLMLSPFALIGIVFYMLKGQGVTLGWADRQWGLLTPNSPYTTFLLILCGPIAFLVAGFLWNSNNLLSIPISYLLPFLFWKIHRRIKKERAYFEDRFLKEFSQRSKSSPIGTLLEESEEKDTETKEP